MTLSPEEALAKKLDAAKVGGRNSAVKRTASRKERQAEFLDCIRAGLTVVKACEAVGISQATYPRWRERFPEFAAAVDATRVEVRAARSEESWDGGFADFRRKYLAHESPDFHLHIIRKIESMDEGEIGLILMPPEHGKTTLLEDFSAYKLSTDPDYRICIGSYREAHGAKLINQLQAYMDPGQAGAKTAMIARFGPFLDPDNPRQIWAAKQMQVAKRSGAQRDPSVQTIGITANAQGIRSDLFIVDDVQGTKSLNETESIVSTLRQDWFTRTGALGRVVIIGTRVGPGDVYEELEAAGLLDWIVRFPAYREHLDRWDAPDMSLVQPKKHPDNLAAAAKVTSFLWPRDPARPVKKGERPVGYTPKDYLVMRINAGEEAWARNYQQKARGAKGGPFSQERLDLASEPLVTVLHQPGQPGTFLAGCRTVALTLDPGFGKNATMAIAMTDKWMMPVAWRVDEGLENNQAIIAILEEYCHQFDLPGGNAKVRHLVVETKAFQKGLATDEAMKRLRKRFGLRLRPHDTGRNKYDPDFGVGAMAEAMQRGEILLPDADDAPTQAMRTLLDADLLRWRPYRRGNKLQQDLTMALWFGFILWRDVRRTLAAERPPITEALQTAALPWRPTSVGLLVPNGR